MTVHWKTFIIRVSFWLTAEVVLNMIGIDDLADYSEYHFEHKARPVASLIMKLS
ncbi:MAG: hypothetical protein QNJ46_19105 [Leptolyngbyaceae cyanobacterium MO_188.B28]|nr:hypothetical protein [Leptolyngbyaceae cyanobacterium MO_188.B28]